MEKVIDVDRAVKISESLRKQGKIIILVGGCFDILHRGHIEFLEQAKKHGDFLFLLLESDEKIRKIKGKNRPVNTQIDRALVLSALNCVDYVINLPMMNSDQEYSDLVNRIKPDIIATTKGDPYKKSKEKQAELINAKVVEVIDRISNQSTTRLIKLLSKQ